MILISRRQMSYALNNVVVQSSSTPMRDSAKRTKSSEKGYCNVRRTHLVIFVKDALRVLHEQLHTLRAVLREVLPHRVHWGVFDENMKVTARAPQNFCGKKYARDDCTCSMTCLAESSLPMAVKVQPDGIDTFHG